MRYSLGILDNSNRPPPFVPGNRDHFQLLTRSARPWKAAAQECQTTSSCGLRREANSVLSEGSPLGRPYIWSS
jgi:hypothetical protein